MNPDSCHCQIATLSLTDSSYIDMDSLVQEESGNYAFFYQVKVSVGNYTRNSFIYNYTNFISPSKIDLENTNVSTNKNRFIEITWDPITGDDTTYFYQYEIWRAPDEELSDTSLVVIITNPNQTKFMDRTVGNGTTWYYSLAVVDINNGRQFSDFVYGWSMP